MVDCPQLFEGFDDGITLAVGFGSGDIDDMNQEVCFGDLFQGCPERGDQVVR